MVSRVDTGGTIQWCVLWRMFRIGVWGGYASPLEEGAVTASPVPLLVVGLSIGWIPIANLKKAIGMIPVPAGRGRLGIVPAWPLPEGPGTARPGLSFAKHGLWASLPGWETSTSWRLLEILPPFDPFKPILVCGSEPGVGFVTDNPRVEKVYKIGISLVDGETGFRFEQGF